MKRKSKPKTLWTSGSVPDIRRRLTRARVSDRKYRLFCVACCTRDRHQIKHEDCLKLIDLAERWADDPSLAAEVAKLRRAVSRWASHAYGGSWLSRWAAWCLASPRAAPAFGFLKSLKYRAILREVVGDLFQPVQFEPGWRSPAAVGIARTMYDSKDFFAMPILADALEEAGCTDERVLRHCRTKKEVHVRGCWVVDLVLGVS